MRSNLALFFWRLLYVVYFVIDARFCVRFSCSVLSQDIGCEERLRSDLFHVVGT